MGEAPRSDDFMVVMGSFTGYMNTIMQIIEQSIKVAYRANSSRRSAAAANLTTRSAVERDYFELLSVDFSTPALMAYVRPCTPIKGWLKITSCELGLNRKRSLKRSLF